MPSVSSDRPQVDVALQHVASMIAVGMATMDADCTRPTPASMGMMRRLLRSVQRGDIRWESLEAAVQSWGWQYVSARMDSGRPGDSLDSRQRLSGDDVMECFIHLMDEWPEERRARLSLELRRSIPVMCSFQHVDLEQFKPFVRYD